MTVLDEVLEHHGIKGMKWGIRRSDTSSSSAHETSMKTLKKVGGVSVSKTEGTADHDAAVANSLHARAQVHGSASLSNKELQQLVSRMNLEQQYTRLQETNTTTSGGKKFVKGLLVNVGKQQVQRVANDQAAKQIAKLLAR